MIHSISSRILPPPRVSPRFGKAIHASPAEQAAEMVVDQVTSRGLALPLSGLFASVRMVAEMDGLPALAATLLGVGSFYSLWQRWVK